jgi:hypothetical protein
VHFDKELDFDEPHKLGEPPERWRAEAVSVEGGECQCRCGWSTGQFTLQVHHHLQVVLVPMVKIP